MQKRQRNIIINFVVIIFITIIAVIAMVVFRDWVNRSEAMRAMEHLSKIVMQYKKDKGAIPPQSYVDRIKENLEGFARMGKLRYRARWIDFGSGGSEILAYSRGNYRLLPNGKGAIVLRLDGHVEWIEKEKFKRILAQHQSPVEIETMND